MAEQMNLGSTLVLLTLADNRKTLVNVETVLRFDERENKEGSYIYFRGEKVPVIVLEDPVHIKKLITGSKLADIKELMKQISGTQSDMIKKMMEDFPEEIERDGRNPFENRDPDDFDGWFLKNK